MDLRAFLESRIAEFEARAARMREGAEVARLSPSDSYANYLPGIQRMDTTARILREALDAYDQASVDQWLG